MSGVALGVGRGSKMVSNAADWLLRDEFISDLAAGSVNGTAAEPGPGTRTVVDTENKLSITGGAATFAGGSSVPVYGNPGLWYGAVTRVAGQVLLATVTVDNNTNKMIGFDSAPGSTLGENYFYFNIWNISPSWLGVTGPIVATYAATTYQISVVLRASGAYYYIKGGAFSNWTMVWVTSLAASATVYPGISNYSSVFSADNLRVPDALWLPTPIVSYGFDE